MRGNIKRSSALHMAYFIVTDKRNSSRYASTSLRDEGGRVIADLGDVVDVIKELLIEALKQEKQEGVK